jgi:hypothetical protein
MENIPNSIQRALQTEREFFWGPDGAEWKLELQQDGEFIEKHVGIPVLIFANNGYGDYLFLKKGQTEAFDETVFEFFHEGPLIEAVAEDLETVLGLTTRPPSSDSYPAPHYESGEPVLLGDRVRFKVWLFFWKGWIEGVVNYVPGISPRRTELERDGLKWIELKGPDETIGSLIDPETGIVKKVRFVGRADAAALIN